MPFSLELWIWVRGLRLGPLRLMPYGLCATLGVVLAMALAGRLARREGVQGDAVWDAGLFAVLSCFGASRLLLILRDPAAFWRFPFTVLALPSLTYEGLVLAGVSLFIYLRWRRLPMLRLLDVFASPAALLAAVLEAGHLLDGSEPGMPTGYLGRTRLPDVQALHLYPVAALGALTAALLCAGLTLAMRAPSRREGQVAAIGLLAGGVVASVLAALSLPAEVLGSDWLEPGQLVALAACLAGGLLWQLSPRRSAATPVQTPGDGTKPLARLSSEAPGNARRSAAQEIL